VNVLCVTNMYPSKSEPQAGIFVHEQVEDLRALGVEIDVLHFNGRTHWFEYVRAMASVRSIVRRNRYDVAHAHYGLTGAVALAQRRVPVVTTFHGSDTGYIPWQARVSRVVARHTTPVFVAKANSLSLRVPGVVVPVGVDTNVFRPMLREEARRRLGWDPQGRYVLFPGAASRRVKRYDLFQAAFALAKLECPELHPILFDGYERDQAPLVMNAIDCVLMTSDWEGSPVTVKEALACETPVVSVPVGDVDDVIGGLPACAVTERDPVRLAAAVVAALDAPRSSVLRERAMLYERRSLASRIVELYEELLMGSHD
jgi:glycosyltransferase involved in cell wall biosynthesis